MENQDNDKNDIKNLYDYQMKLYMQVSKEKKDSLYFFIFINTLVLLSNVWLEINYSSTTIPLFLICFDLIAMIGCFLCLYWYKELRELQLFHETRFRILLELEKKCLKLDQ